MTPPLHGESIAGLLELMRTGAASSKDVVSACLARVESVEPRIRAFLSLRAEEALREAEAVDTARARGAAPGLLAGVPIALKDIIGTRGWETTCGSRILRNYVPVYDATATERLRRAGAVIIGKTNMDEFAMGSSTEHSAFQVTRNPWDTDRVPGGSSGGSAAAVAAREVPGALGTDTGGSVRQPAAFTGVVGLKPTYGRVSRYGLVAFASSLDQIGPLARTVADCARLLQVVAGHDPSDMTSSHREVPDYLAALARGVRGLRVGVPVEYFPEGLDAEVAASMERCHRILEEAGAKLVEVSLPQTRHAIATYYIIATAEASSNLARFDGVRFGYRANGAESLRALYEETRGEGFGAEVRRRILLGTFVLSAGYYDAYYLKAQKVRALLRRDFENVWDQCDLLAVPTTPGPAFRLGEKTDDPLAMYLSDIFTVTANLAGIPAISVPGGFTRGGLPLGCQLLGKFFEESTLFAAGRVIEDALALKGPHPKLPI
ncbi:MAG: Asp-tRNA(Asn)/Glu-tRNA(Gln) amidotransferase subunit GatA [Acidobacteria bacterium]|nr:Asp-tRNA(Asn)/Glu-tRNA(Gln) amidotransferase subunit GatA [Acidobacteriota bacterium]